jgi:hypothetical protein
MAILPVKSSKTTGEEASGDTIFDWPMQVPFALANSALHAASLEAKAGIADTAISAAAKSGFLIEISPAISMRFG